MKSNITRGGLIISAGRLIRREATASNCPVIIVRHTTSARNDFNIVNYYLVVLLLL